MCDSTGVHITRIYVNCTRKTPSPIRSSNTIPVCTSTPISNIDSTNSILQQQVGLLAKEVLALQQGSSEILIQNTESLQNEQYIFISKGTGQQIDFLTGEGITKITNSNTGTINKKKKRRQSNAVLPTISSRSSKSSDDGDYSVVTNNDMPLSNEKKKANFTSYDGIQVFTFTLDDD
ncbi:unnamed protein product [Rotaria sordida]|uniref:Uncharacterized protein n=1 Tax=Rotaria sordida TaxID=392033 RepID=A0A813PFQ2_9BILA|nr:unnamed protein product [Rotaria sordida]CAF0754947.1 unnamed protein product [Rotaria sordida]CAF0763673.1 unnamed protein product [Rotaria sordida]CAF0797189.1 unnamed protein product [Rotaria sordida]CAF0830616.1 unnamed protein product [Rotaria sordida]